MVHKAFLVQQWHERIHTFLQGAVVGIIRQNATDAEADIVVGMIQTILKRDYAADAFQNFGLVIIDEAHHMSAPVFSKALQQLPSAKRLALSATPERKDGLTPLLHWSMGDICHRICRMPEHTLVSCMIYKGGTRKEIMCRNGKPSIPSMLNALAKDPVRNACIAKRIVACYQAGRNIIVLTDRKLQLQALTNMIIERGVTPKDAAWYVGDTPVEDRESAASKRVIMSTYSMAKEALDIPRLDTLVQGTPKGDVVQACGRVQRKCQTKQTPLVIDVIDTFSVFEQLRWKRHRFYKQEGFQCQVFDATADTAEWF